MLADVAENFPVHLWDRLLPQIEITLNLIRQSNSTVPPSAYAYLCGPFDFNKRPLVPMGCATQIYEKTDKPGTCTYHSVDGWYLSTSLEHYRTHLFYARAIQSKHLSGIVQFRHKHITNPTIAYAKKVTNATADCTKAINSFGAKVLYIASFQTIRCKTCASIKTIAMHSILAY